jgi:hypothetical protein
MTRKFVITTFILIGSTMMLAAQTASRYDRAAEGAITGTILHVVSGASADGIVGVHLDLKTNDGLLDVALGPALFVGQNNFWFYAEERVEIISARMPRDGRTVWVRAIMKGSTVLVLRHEDGTPKWAPAIDGTDGCGVVHPALPRITE